MSDYMPTTDEVRDAVNLSRAYGLTMPEQTEHEITGEVFDRWLAQERAQAQAEALIYAADALRVLRKYLVSGYEYEKWLRNRANEVEKEVLGYEK